MEILFIFAVAFIAAAIAGKVTKTSTSKPPCKLHKWTRDPRGFMFCSECNGIAGHIPTDYDKPY